MIAKAAVKTSGKVGVIQEGLGAFFDRFPREGYVVLRAPRMTLEMRERGLARLRELVGKGYDSELNLSNDAYSRSALAVEMFKAAYAGASEPRSWVGTRPVAMATITDDAATPENSAASPDFVVTAANGPGTKAPTRTLETYVLDAKGRQPPRGHGRRAPGAGRPAAAVTPGGSRCLTGGCCRACGAGSPAACPSASRARG